MAVGHAGQCIHIGYSQARGVRPRVRHSACGLRAADQRRRAPASACSRPVAADEAARAVERAGRELARQQAVARRSGPGSHRRRSPRPRSRSGRSTARRRPAARRGGRAAWPRRSARSHQRRADAAAAVVRGDGERPEQQRRPRRAGGDVPQPHGADDAAAVGRDERQPVAPAGGPRAAARTSCWKRAVPKRGRAAPRAPRRRDEFLADRDHDHARVLPPARAGASCELSGDRGAGYRPAPGDLRCGRSSAARSR